MARSGESIGFVEAREEKEITPGWKVHISNGSFHSSTSVVSGAFSAGEPAEPLTRKLTAAYFAQFLNTGAHSVRKDFSYLAWKPRSAAAIVPEESGDRKCDSERSSRTRYDEQCFERIMWSFEEMSSDFRTASYTDQDDHRCRLSEYWFQKDAQHYDEEQKKRQAGKEARGASIIGAQECPCPTAITHSTDNLRRSFGSGCCSSVSRGSKRCQIGTGIQEANYKWALMGIRGTNEARNCKYLSPGTNI